MKKLISDISSFLSRIFKRRYYYEFCKEVPISYNSKIIYVIGETHHPWLLSFICPCGCKKIIYLNLLKETTPCWIYKIKDEKISISPSIWRIDGCKSHFFLKENKIQWV